MLTISKDKYNDSDTLHPLWENVLSQLYDDNCLIVPNTMSQKVLLALLFDYCFDHDLMCEIAEYVATYYSGYLPPIHDHDTNILDAIDTLF